MTPPYVVSSCACYVESRPCRVYVASHTAVPMGVCRVNSRASARISILTSIIMQSAVPSVLNCADLLTEIFSWLRPPNPRCPYDTYTGYRKFYALEREQRKELRGTLCQAALVCQAFTPHALDNLWCVMDELLPLLLLLPPLCCGDGDDDDNDNDDNDNDNDNGNDDNNDDNADDNDVDEDAYVSTNAPAVTSSAHPAHVDRYSPDQ